MPPMPAVFVSLFLCTFGASFTEGILQKRVQQNERPQVFFVVVPILIRNV